MRRRHFTGLLALLIVISSCSQEKSQDTGRKDEDKSGLKAEIKFDQSDHDFGTIEQGETVGCNFTFKNTGEASLVILDASTSCGCTVPRFSTEPVLPGGSGTVEVRFDSEGRIGQQSKTVTIRTNGKNPVVKLTIRANIINLNS